MHGIKGKCASHFPDLCLPVRKLLRGPAGLWNPLFALADTPGSLSGSLPFSVQVAPQRLASAPSHGQCGLGGLGCVAPGSAPAVIARDLRGRLALRGGGSAVPGDSSPTGGAGLPWLIRVGLGRVFFLPEERHM